MRANLRSSVVLGIVAAVLLGYILVVERGSLSSSELEQRKDSALPQFVRAHLSKIEIQRKGKRTVLERDPDELDESGLWHVAAPYRAKADRDTVESLIGELEFLDARRKLEHVSAQDQKRFGFDAPRYRLWFTVGRLRVPVVVGNESPRGDGVYMRGGDPEVAFVVGKDLIESLDHDPGDYHTRELHDGVLVSTTVALALRDAQGERSIRKRDDGSWTFEPPLSGLASKPTATDLINALDALRAKHFVAEDVKDLAPYGLSSPQFELRLRKKRVLGAAAAAKGPDAPRQEDEVRFRVGSACPGHPGESYFMTGDSGTVFCVADADLAKIRKSADDLREARLLPFEDDEIASVRVQGGGLKLVVTKKDGGFSYQASRPGAAALDGDARADAVEDWFKALRGESAEHFAPEATAGRGDGTLLLHVDRAQDDDKKPKKPAYDVRLQPQQDGTLLARRDGDPLALVLPASAAPLLEPAAARLRPLDILHVREDGVRAIELRRGQTTERLERAGQNGFAVVAPEHVPADSIASAELVRLLASLEAVRFAADAPRPEHGLASPWLTVALEYDADGNADNRASKAEKSGKPQRIVLTLGAETEGGRFAQRSGQAGVFVVSSQLTQLLAEPLASRTLLATPLERIAAIDLEQAGRHVHVERHGDDAFVAAPGGTLDVNAARALAEAVATLRASHLTGYGPATADEGLAHPYARITVKPVAGGDARPYTVVLGAQGQDGRYARRSDRELGFILPDESISKLLAPLPRLAAD